MGTRNFSDIIMINRHTLWVVSCSHFWSYSRVYFRYFLLTLGDPLQVQSVEQMIREGAHSAEMVGERCRKEPAGDFEKWRSREKVWEKLVEGGVTNFIMKLHGFDQEVTKSMVESWKDGRVKVNGVYFRIMEEVIAIVTEIPTEGFKFFRDKKLSANAVREFVESEKELKALWKIDTYYVPDSIKKRWRYVLRAVIE